MGSSQVWTLAFIFLSAVLCKTTKGVNLTVPSGPYLRDSVTLSCVGSSLKNVNFYKDGAVVKENTNHQFIRRSDTTVELIILSVSESDQGWYSCGINEETQSTKKELWVLEWSRTIKLKPSNYTIPDQGRVTLSCNGVYGVQKYEWIRRSSVYDSQPEILKETSKSVTVSRGGVYSCRGKDDLILTPQSNNVTIWETGLTLPSLDPYLRDSVTLRCVGPAVKYLYFYKDGAAVKEDMNHKFKQTSDTTVELIILSVSKSDQGWYSCGINENTRSTQKRLRVLERSRSIELTPSNYTIPDQGRVTLSCSVERLQTYQWIRHSSVYDSQLEILDEDTSSISISRGGVYSCRGKDQFILSEESTAVTIRETAVSKEKSSSVLVMVTVGAVCVIVLVILLLLLLWRYRKTKDMGHNQQTETGLGSEAQNVSREDSHLYSSLLHGDRCVYETISGSKNNDNDDEQINDYENVP